MKLAITGATGFLGSHCAAESFRKGYSIRLLVRNQKKAHKALEMHHLKPKDFEIVQADLQDEESLADGIKGVDFLLHAAAVFSLSPLDAKTMLKVNPSSTEALLSAAAEYGVKQTVYVSTMGVFAPIDGKDINENTATSTGLGPYTTSKINSEKIARRFQKDGHSVNIVYPGGIFGPIDPNPDLSDSMGMLSEILKRNIGLSAKGAKLAMVDVRDVANVCVGALTATQNRGRFHAWGDLVSMDEVIELVREITNRNLKFLSSPLFILDALGLLGEIFTLTTRIRLPFAKESMRMFTQNARVGGPGNIDHSLVEEEFSFPKYTLENSLLDALRWLHETGHLTSKQAGKLANI